MGEGQKQGFQVSFNRFLRVAFQGSRVTSSGAVDQRRKTGGEDDAAELPPVPV